MGQGSRWERWAHQPYRTVAMALVCVAIGLRYVPGLSPTAHRAATVCAFPLLIIGAVLLLGPMLHRARRRQDDEIRRNPTGKTVPLDDRLAEVDHPRARWVLSLALAVAFALATVWATTQAVSAGGGPFVGFAIYLFVPVPFFAWLTLRTRTLLRRPS